MPSPQGSGRIDHYTNGVLSSTRSMRPFADYGSSLSALLAKDFAYPALRWLAGTGGPESPSVTAGAHAEVGLTILAAIEYLSQPQAYFPSADERSALVDRVGEMTAWLVDVAEVHADGSRCWDHSTWDSGTVIRALFRASGCGLVSTQTAGDARAAAFGGIEWLFRHYQQVSSPMGVGLNPAEYAQLGRVLCAAHRESGTPGASGLMSMTRAEAAASIVHVCEILLRRQSERKIEVEDANTGRTTHAAIWWDDWFGTAEVLTFLVEVSTSIGSAGLTVPDHVREALRRAIFECVLLIENSQVDGLWGAYLDTIAVLDAYVLLGTSASSLMGTLTAPGELVAEPRIVFRAVRWMCDPTQRASDGSVLHTAFLTTFFAIACIDVAFRWPLASMKLGELYDDLSLRLDVGVTSYRVGQVSALLERDAAAAEADAARASLDSARARQAHHAWRESRTLLTLFLGLVWLTGTGLLLSLTDVVEIAVHVKDSGDAYTILGLTSAVVLGVIATIWGVSRPGGDDA